VSARRRTSGNGEGRPQASSDDVRARMSRQPSRDTRPELMLRRILHRRGLRYRVDVAVVKGLRRKADIVFRGARVAVFVHGCFWHGCPEHATWPKANAAWWRAKIERNRERDRETERALDADGWTVVRVWEHEAADAAAARVCEAVENYGRK
jgi:DNA mismatch endonuclease (patch repair protein)